MDLFTRQRLHSYHDDQFNIDVEELDENSPKCDQPANINVTLKDHQLTLLYRAKEYENRSIKLSEFRSLANVACQDDFFDTKIGVIADRVGSGKTYIALSLILTNQNASTVQKVIKNAGANNISFHLSNTKEVMHASIIVIPFSLCHQWETYIKNFSPSIKYKLVNKTKIIQEMSDKIRENYSNIDIFVVTSTFYQKFVDISRREQLKYRRVVFDEADSITINQCPCLEANFYWFITASYGNLLYPRGFARSDSQTHRFIWYADGLKSTGYIRNIFTDLYYSVPRDIFKTIILKNSEAYVQRSIELPPLLTHFIQCHTPQSISVLNGIVDKNIITCLNAGDIQGALNYVKPSQKLSEENIIQLVIEKYQNQLETVSSRLPIIEQLQYTTGEEKNQEIDSINKKIQDIQKTIELIKERVTSSDVCNICYDEYETKTVVTCCQNSFCFKCINLWINRKAVCPLCKTKLENNMLFVCDETQKEHTHIRDKVEEEKITIGNVHGFVKTYDKYKNLEVLLENKKQGKILIFSNYDTSFTSIFPVLDKLHIRYDFLKGNGNHVRNIIDKYKNGDISVLLVNTRFYGSGFNLENTSDIIMFHKFDNEIEKQVIGRGQRIGRNCPLNIWYLVHDNEHHT